MKLAAARALAALAKEPVPAEVSAAYEGQTFSFGQDYVIPKPFDPRLVEWLPPAVAQAAMDTGVARRPIEDMDAYKASLRVRIQKAQGRANALIERGKEAFLERGFLPLLCCRNAPPFSSKTSGAVRPRASFRRPRRDPALFGKTPFLRMQRLRRRLRRASGTSHPVCMSWLPCSMISPSFITRMTSASRMPSRTSRSSRSRRTCSVQTSEKLCNVKGISRSGPSTASKRRG